MTHVDFDEDVGMPDSEAADTYESRMFGNLKFYEY